MNTPQPLSITSKYIKLIPRNKMDDLKLFPPTNLGTDSEEAKLIGNLQ